MAGLHIGWVTFLTSAQASGRWGACADFYQEDYKNQRPAERVIDVLYEAHMVRQFQIAFIQIPGYSPEAFDVHTG